MNNGKDGIGEFVEDAKRLGISFNNIEAAKVDAAGDALDRANKAIDGLVNTLTIELAPVITEIADSFTNWLTESVDGTDKVNGALGQLVPTLAAIASGLDTINIGFKSAQLGTTGLIKYTNQLGLLGPLGLGLPTDTFDPAIKQLNQELDELMLGQDSGERVKQWFTDAARAADELAANAGKANKAVENIGASATNNVEETIKTIQQQIMDLGKSKELIAIDKAMGEGASPEAVRHAREILSIFEEQKKVVDLAKDVRDNMKSPFEKWKEDLDLLQKALDQGLINKDQFNMKLDDNLRNLAPDFEDRGRPQALRFGTQEARSRAIANPLAKPINKLVDVSQQHFREAQEQTKQLKQFNNRPQEQPIEI